MHLERLGGLGAAGDDHPLACRQADDDSKVTAVHGGEALREVERALMDISASHPGAVTPRRSIIHKLQEALREIELGESARHDAHDDGDIELVFEPPLRGGDAPAGPGESSGGESGAGTSNYGPIMGLFRSLLAKAEENPRGASAVLADAPGPTATQPRQDASCQRASSAEGFRVACVTSRGTRAHRSEGRDALADSRAAVFRAIASLKDGIAATRRRTSEYDKAFGKTEMEVDFLRIKLERKVREAARDDGRAVAELAELLDVLWDAQGQERVARGQEQILLENAAALRYYLQCVEDVESEAAQDQSPDSVTRALTLVQLASASCGLSGVSTRAETN
ncbi:unnamed protein product [Pedinophyceae sp. YPF-701]|nr:unnamed protein product [Pedinophyceae sp. YPF-701]